MDVWLQNNFCFPISEISKAVGLCVMSHSVRSMFLARPLSDNDWQSLSTLNQIHECLVPSKQHQKSCRMESLSSLLPRDLTMIIATYLKCQSLIVIGKPLVHSLSLLDGLHRWSKGGDGSVCRCSNVYTICYK
jgi:hypothetical protein